MMGCSPKVRLRPPQFSLGVQVDDLSQYKDYFKFQESSMMYGTMNRRFYNVNLIRMFIQQILNWLISHK
jgi:hypothetical protein